MTFNNLFVGLTTVDIQYFVEKFPGNNIKIKTTEPDILVGGPATNASVAFSFLNNGANLVSQVGENAFSAFINFDFKHTNLNLRDLAAGQNIKPVIASVVTSSNGDRNIFTHNPTEVVFSLKPKDLFLEINPEIVLLDGFYPGFAVEIARIAHRNGVPVILDCGSWKLQYQHILPFAECAICSADFLPPGCENESDVFAFMKNAGVKNVAISRGDKDILYEGIDRSGSIKVPKVNVLDTLGAGDFLHGAFCYYYLRTREFTEALKNAAFLASHTCSFKGTREWLNKYHESLSLE